MSYDHQFNAYIQFNAPVTKDKLFELLSPISSEFDWTPEEILNNDVQAGSEVQVGVNEQGQVVTVMISTSDEASYEFPQKVQALADSLTTVAVTGSMELVDLDTSSIDTAKQIIWYGNPADVVKAKLSDAWEKCKDILLSAGVSEEKMEAFQKLAEA